MMTQKQSLELKSYITSVIEAEIQLYTTQLVRNDAGLKLYGFISELTQPWTPAHNPPEGE